MDNVYQIALFLVNLAHFQGDVTVVVVFVSVLFDWVSSLLSRRTDNVEPRTSSSAGLRASYFPTTETVSFYQKLSQ